jgi:uncharacterized membrane protein
MNTESRPQPKFLPVLSVLLAIVAWVAAVVYLSYAMGDINAEDPATKAKLLAQHQMISRASLALFIASLIGSSWLGGHLYQSNRAASIAVLFTHMAAIFGAFFVLLR